MMILGSHAFERSYTLEGETGQHEPNPPPSLLPQREVPNSS
jgi:hypothetical protein